VVHVNEQNIRFVFSPQLANYLLSKGYTIVDLKQKKENPDASIFIFRDDDGLMNEIAKWKLSK
jgi:DNA/RNA-binding domain of Phe-tRNA-synthetase-like protein